MAVAARFQELRRMIGGLLETRLNGALSREGNGWSFDSGVGRASPVRARLSEDWLIFEGRRFPFDQGEDFDWNWRLLKVNRGVPGTARFALDSGLKPFLLADAPIAGEIDLASWVDRNLCGIRTLSGIDFPSWPIGSSEDPTGPRGEAERGKHWDDLYDSIERTGWPCHRRGDAAAVDLEVPGRAFQARVESRRLEKVRLEVELGTAESPPREVRTALGLFLLGCNACIPLVRCCRTGTEDRADVRVEVELPGSPSQTELDRALSALSTFCRDCAPAVEILLDPRIASTYRAARGVIEERGQVPARETSTHNPEE